jgi:peptide/nickel transport system substrate-binding protein
VKWCRQSSVIAAALVAGACAGEPAVDEPDPAAVPAAERYGGTAVVAGLGEIQTMNAFFSRDYMTDQFQAYVLFMTLLRYDDALQPEPYLARSWTVGPDSNEVVFELRDDVYWHDGTPTTAYDVAFTFDRVKDPAVPFPNRSSFDAWESAEVLDPHTIRFTLRPHADFLHGWTALPVMPRHILDGTAAEDLATHPFGTSEPVGNGPFRFVEHRPGDRWIFEANPDFPDELGGRPYLDRLVYRVVPNETTLFAELRSGGVDMYVRVAPAFAERIEDDPDLRLVAYPFPNYSFIAWNSRRPFFESASVRRALTMAIDRSEIVEVVRHGLATPAVGPVGPWHWAYDSAWRPIAYAPDSAASILESAGWRDVDGDGVREREGVRFSFDISTNESRERVSIAELVQRYLAQVGVEARPRIREHQTVIADVTSPERRFDAFLLSWTQGLVLDERDQWACGRIGKPLQFTSYCNPELDAVMDSIPRATDRSAQARLIRRYNMMLAADQPFTFLYVEKRADALRRRLQGASPDFRGELADVRSWWLFQP